ncbi:hypothetical protein EGR_11157 [Echinococcus granulosus]|uniref:Uncharacterized protein n=1 Tax=Echinococcus granulosus TaxID=6210 RepID=W6U0M9_ECHGR|nr:hypothetical protein EGR_11157 [Echinococcus granulosus]EUB53986.1 hypothetical protein EGR_11157 [Echinococcus granulosus]
MYANYRSATAGIFIAAGSTAQEFDGDGATGSLRTVRVMFKPLLLGGVGGSAGGYVVVGMGEAAHCERLENST